MPRIKSVPTPKRPLVDDNVSQSGDISADEVVRTTPKRRKSCKKVYEFAVEEEFEKFLIDANFYLTINYFNNTQNEDSIPDSSHCLLGSFTIGLIGDKPIDNCFDINSIEKQLIYIYVKHRPFESVVYYECRETKTGKHFYINFINTLKSINSDLINALISNQIYLTTNLLLNENCLTIDVWLQESALKHLAYHSEATFKPNYDLLKLMNYFYEFPDLIEHKDNAVKVVSNESVEELYSKIKDKHKENKHNIPAIDVQHPALYPTLRSYQVEAVQWMLNRERIETISSHQLLYERMHTIDGKSVNYNKYLGYFCDEKSFPMKYIYGLSQSGILADEMGLGKTVEVLSLILSNSKPTISDSNDSHFNLELDPNEDTKDFFACICGQLCNVEKYKRKHKVFGNYTNGENNSETDIDSNNTDCDDETDSEMNDPMVGKIFDKQINKISVSKFVNNKPIVKVIEKQTKRKKRKKKTKLIVQCQLCFSYQHSDCVNYDVSSGRPYYCGHCWVREGMKPVDSRATLIVSPRSICHQWQTEILKHLDCSNLKIFVYEGVKGNLKYIQPFDLADNDIVLTTYETLRNEIDFVNLHHSNRFRYPKRFNSTPSPLIAVNYHRIVLDEAQMVESQNAKTAQMANRLHGRHRWCVTGTPIQRSINDLFGLLLFIGEEPYHERLYWESMLYWPYSCGNSEPMITALSNCFWRTSKSDVWEQLEIPMQTSTVKTLQFSPVEQHFYLRQHSECQRKFTEKMIKFSDLDIKLKELDRKTANILMTPMLSLRQACCHPQAVRGKFLPISKKTLTMEELLKTMIKNTQYESEEEHRRYIMAVNGIAAIHIIEKDYEKAIEFYRKALNSIENYKAKDLFRTDKLQQIHTLHNLAEVLEKCGIKQKDKDSDEFYNKENDEQMKTTSITVSVEIGRTLRDEYLKYESIQIYNQYLAKGMASFAEVNQQLGPLTEAVEAIEKSFHSSNANPWWKSAIDYLRANEEEHNLIARVKDTLEQHSLRGTLGEEQLSKFVSISTKFRESSGLVYVLDKCLRELRHSRSVLRQRVQNLNSKPTDSDLNEAIDCHLRPERDKEGNRAHNVVKCKYCRIHEMFNDYEMKLYYFSAEEKTEESACKSMALMEKQRRGNWGDSETEQCLKVINQLFRYKANSGLGQHKEILSDGANHIKLLEALKKEFRGLRAVWTETYDFVSQIDELNMASIRMRVRLPDEPKPTEAITYILEPNQVSTQLLTLKSDEVIARNALVKKLSHLYYLNNLSKNECSRRGGHNPEMCPICRFQLGEQWGVLGCSHSICIKCIDILISQYSRNSGTVRCIQCALCRELCPLSAILYVNSTAENEECASIPVTGSWSTKVEEVVRCLLKIMSEEPTAKTLVFSTWTDVLQLISNAFLDNHINHCFIKNSAKFSQKIDTFKQNSDIRALLMQMDLGSKGINLIEATHVVLVEPTLNKANELQAVGRVHRIGQMKPTFVHRFIVKNTIEERISQMYSNAIQTNDTQSLQLAETSEHAFITLNQMKTLFDGI